MIRTLIGVDLGGTNVRAGRVEGDSIAAHIARPVSSRGTEQQVIDEVSRIIERVLTPEVSGIGIGVPSLVDTERGIVYTVENIPSWKEVHLKAILEKRFGLPVQVNNDANCFAVGEYHFGLGRGCRNMVGIVVGTGLGAGIILRGRLYSGVNCGAGELGCIPYKGHTIEYYASGTRLVREQGINGQLLHERAMDGDPQALRAFQDFGADFAQALMIALYAFDPERVVLGGSVAKAFPLWEGVMRAKLKAFAYPHALKRLEILPSQEPHIAILGAAALLLDADGKES